MTFVEYIRRKTIRRLRIRVAAADVHKDKSHRLVCLFFASGILLGLPGLLYIYEWHHDWGIFSRSRSARTRTRCHFYHASRYV
jgi:hypothetical protein